MSLQLRKQYPKENSYNKTATKQLFWTQLFHVLTLVGVVPNPVFAFGTVSSPAPKAKSKTADMTQYIDNTVQQHTTRWYSLPQDGFAYPSISK